MKEFSGNPLDANNKYPVSGQPDYTEKQLQYQSYMQQRLRRAQEVRDRMWAEFSDKTYLQYYEQNEKIANTYVEPVKNTDDPKISSGTIESKLTTLLSNLASLNLTPEVLAFAKNMKKLVDLGTALTDILDETAEHDGGDEGGDDEKKLLRQRELLKQGTAFIQEKWCKRYQMKKTLKKAYNGEFDGVGWDAKLEKVFEGPERDLLYGPNVYLGDITQFSIEDQPYVFTVEQMSYDKAKETYGKFQNWPYVKPGMPPTDVSLAQNMAGGRTIYDGKFRLTTLKDDQVEVIKYQDPTRDEFEIMINSILMLPIGFPLSAVTPGGRFNLTKQILLPINPQFAYGKSFVQSGDVYELSKIIDEMLRLFVLKTRKAVTPPYVNLSGKVISRRVLAPGNISMGVPQGALQAIGTESQGVTSGEYQIYSEIKETIEKSTVSPIFQGQFGKSGTTATESDRVYQQAKLSLGLIIAACTLMEQKLGYLRLWNVLANWFEAQEEIMDEDGSVQKQYRMVTRDANIPGAGKGMRKVIPVAGDVPPTDVIREMELKDEKDYGYATQRIYLSVSKLRAAEIVLRVVVIPKEKESSISNKSQFREMMGDVMALVQVGLQPDTAALLDEFTKVWGRDKGKVLSVPSPSAPVDPRALAARAGGANGMPPSADGIPTPSNVNPGGA